MCHIPLFLAKMAWPCTSCDVITPWPDMTRSKCFYQKLRKWCPISCAKFQHDPPHSSGCIAKKNSRVVVASTPPPLPGRGLKYILWRWRWRSFIMDEMIFGTLWSGCLVESYLFVVKRFVLCTYLPIVYLLNISLWNLFNVNGLHFLINIF